MSDMTTQSTDQPVTDAGAPAGAFSRRRVVGGAVGAGIATVGLARLGFAQTTGTPEASTDATPTTTTGTGGTTVNDDTGADADRLAAVIERATAVIDAVKTDRDAVVTDIDTETVDAVLDQASSLLTDAQDASATTNVALRLAHAASGTALIARLLIIAQLTYAGLPSQETRASRVLANAYERISNAGDATDEADTDVSFFITTAQALYASAYDLYVNNAFAQASATARAAAGLAGIAQFLSGDGPGAAQRGQAGGEMRGGMMRGGMGAGPMAPGEDDETDAPAVDAGDQDEPVTVPEPEF